MPNLDSTGPLHFMFEYFIIEIFEFYISLKGKYSRYGTHFTATCVKKSGCFHNHFIFIQMSVTGQKNYKLSINNKLFDLSVKEIYVI